MAIYPSKGQYWVEDYLYYSMDTLPEFLALTILCWPTLMARIGQGYPRATDPEKAKKLAKGELSPEDLRSSETGPSNEQAGSAEKRKQQDEMDFDRA